MASLGLDGGSGWEAIVVIILVAILVSLRLLGLKRGNAMRTRCPKCGTVFDMPFVPGIHIGPWRYAHCPSCEKGALMRTGIKDPLTWPIDESGSEIHPKGPSEQEEMDRRIQDSKYD
jgi:hypothetical protein